MAVNMGRVRLKSFEDMFGTAAEPVSEENVVMLNISELHEFRGHAFKVQDDSDMDELVDSILTHGIIYPIEVRKIEAGYEIISGHRRTHAGKRAGLTEIPAVVRELDDLQAQIRMVAANKYRNKILPSEKGKAYLIEMNAIKVLKKEKPDGVRSDSELAKSVGDSRANIHRYIRLVNLIEELIDLVDADIIGIIPAQPLCKLPHKFQMMIYKVWSKQNNPRFTQNVTDALFNIYHETSNLSDNDIMACFGLLKEIKPKPVKLFWNEKKLFQYFPQDYSQEQIEEVIEDLLGKWAEENKKA